MSKIFGERLKKLRLKRGMYQIDLADEFKITRPAVSAWECGVKEPSIENILKLCDILDTTPNYLLGYDNDEDKK